VPKFFHPAEFDTEPAEEKIHEALAAFDIRVAGHCAVSGRGGTFFRLVAEVVTDWVNLSDWLPEEELVRRYDWGTKGKWGFCG